MADATSTGDAGNSDATPLDIQSACRENVTMAPSDEDCKQAPVDNEGGGSSETAAENMDSTSETPQVEGGSASSGAAAPASEPSPAEIAVESGDHSPPAANFEEGVAPPTPVAESETTHNSAGQAEPSNAPPSEVAAFEEVYYPVKHITFEGRKVCMLCQTVNGPCPLLAIANTLLLRGDIRCPSHEQEIMSASTVNTMITEYILRKAETEPSQEHRLVGIMDILPSLNTGLDVNVRFHKCDGFEYTAALDIFDCCRIRLMHGWVYDSSDELLKSCLAEKTYNEVAVECIASDHEVFRSWLNETGGQLTYPGLHAIHETLEKGEIAVFFRNNHFSTIYRMEKPGNIFQLVTDVGYLEDPYVVWECVSDVDGSSQLYTETFQLRGDALDAQYAASLERAERVQYEQSQTHQRQQHQQQRSAPARRPVAPPAGHSRREKKKDGGCVVQ